MNRLDALLSERTARARRISGRAPIVVVAMATHEEVIRSIARARDAGIARFILVGGAKEIELLAREHRIALDEIRLIDAEDPLKSCREAARLAASGDADVLMKGMVQTADFMHALLSADLDLVPAGRLLSHVALLDVPRYHKLLALSDSAVNIAPSLEDKAAIVRNGIDILRRVGIRTPKVALVAPVETVNPKIDSTVDAAALRERFSPQSQGTAECEAIVEGPFGFDVAVSTDAAGMKKIPGHVAGDADLIIVPNLDTGNVLYKSLTILAGAAVAGVVMGARVPVVLTSRADSDEAKLSSLMLAVATARSGAEGA